TPNVAQAARYPQTRPARRTALADSPEPVPIVRTYSDAVGATDGSIIAAIITTHSRRKPARPSPIVPIPAPMSAARRIVTAHATAAAANSPLQILRLARRDRAPRTGSALVTRRALGAGRTGSQDVQEKGEENEFL